MRVSVIASLLFVLSSPAFAQQINQSHMMHGQGMAMGSGSLPSEAGQSAFAAIQEIVQMLESDPKTDWSKVNVEALRQHLIDMNNVTLGSVVAVSENGNQILFDVSGEGSIGASIKRMVLAHVAVMNGVDGLMLAAKETAKGAVLSVTASDAPTLAKVKGLGFIGIMAMGMHHQQHHWMIATGSSPHQ